MRRSSRLVCAVGLALSLFSPMVVAAPPALERVPANAVAAITVPSLARVHKNADAFLKAVEAPFPIPGLDEILMQIGIEENKGFDPAKGSVAITFVPPAQNGEDEQPNPDEMIVIVVETTGYADFVGNFQVTPAGAGAIDAGNIQGSDAFFKDLGGGFVAMAPKKENIERAEWKQGAIKANVGKSAQTVLDSSDLALIVFTEQAKRFMPQLKEALEDQMANNPAGQALGPLKDSPLGEAITGSMMEDSTSMVTGLRTSASGIALDLAVSFKEGSDSSKMLDGVSGSSAQMLSKLPAGPYLFALATDLSSPGARRLINDMTANMALQADDAVGQFMSSMLTNSDGGALVMGMPPGGLMGGGLLTGTLAYIKTSNPDAFIKSMRQGLEQMNGKSAEGLSVTTAYAAGGSEVEGNKVDTWEIKIKPDEDADDMGQMAMALPMIFGQAGGPGGYIARTDGGLLQTFAKSPTLMLSAMNAGKGGDNFMSDKALAKVSEQLPKNRVGELYVGVKSIMEAALPLMAMQFDVDNIEVPPSLPPIGVGFAGDSTGLHVGAYVPAPTLKIIVAVVEAVQAAQMAGDDWEDEEDPAPGNKNDAKKGAGQPRF